MEAPDFFPDEDTMKTEQAPLTNPFDLLKQCCERPWEVAVNPFKVAPHTWYVGNSWVGAYLIETSAGLILIDATCSPRFTWYLKVSACSI